MTSAAVETERRSVLDPIDRSSEVLSFIFIHNLPSALQLSAAIVIVMPLISGCNWGRPAGLRRAWVGAVMVVLGANVTAVVIALGG